MTCPNGQGHTLTDIAEVTSASPTEESAGEQGTQLPSDRRTRKGSGLDSMVLAELKQLAGSLGIKGTGAMRKSQLIDAIRAAQRGTPTATVKDVDGQDNGQSQGGQTSQGVRRAKESKPLSRATAADSIAPTAGMSPPRRVSCNTRRASLLAGARQQTCSSNPYSLTSCRRARLQTRRARSGKSPSSVEMAVRAATRAAHARIPASRCAKTREHRRKARANSGSRAAPTSRPPLRPALAIMSGATAHAMVGNRTSGRIAGTATSSLARTSSETIKREQSRQSRSRQPGSRLG